MFHFQQQKMSNNSLGIPGISETKTDAPISTKPKSKSELGRNKVLLKPGKGLLDWIRLSNAGRLTPHPPQKAVDHTELAKHNRETDCWILLFDMVYDVTQYLDFHPGGVPQLMRAAGTDATELFNHYHKWVNYKNMLKSCVIGPFVGQRDKLPKPKDEPPTVTTATEEKN